METPGAYLKSKREALHISLQEVSQVTRIRRSILEAIENNRYDLLPPKVFAQGFIKSYASYLGLDESEVIKRYAEMVDVPDADVKTADMSAPRSFAGLLFIIVVVAGLLLGGAFLWWTNFREKQSSDMMPQQTEPAAASRVRMTPPPDEDVGGEDERNAAEPLGASVSTMQTDEGGSTAAIVDQQPSETAGQQPSSVTVEQPRAAIVEQKPAVVTAGQQPADAAAGPLVLKIVAFRTTWMRVQSDKERPIEFTLREGQTHTVNAAEKFAIRIGNAGGVDLFLNEQELGRLGKQGEVLDLMLPE